MSYTTSTGAVCCPFFTGHSAHELRCEGLVEKSYISQMFKRKSDRELHERIFCEARYQNCEICRMLMRDKYGED